MAALVHAEPADGDRHGRIDAHSDEEDGRVFGLVVRVDGEQDGGSGETGAVGEHEVQVAVVSQIGRCGEEHYGGEGGGCGGYVVQLGFNGRVAVRFDYRGAEVGETLVLETGELLNASNDWEERRVGEGRKE